MRQLISCSFQQEPPAHGCRSFFDDCSDQPVELRAALIGLARQILRSGLSVQGVGYNRREAACPVPTIRFFHASGSSSRRNHRQRWFSPPDRMYQSSSVKGGGWDYSRCNWIFGGTSTDPLMAETLTWPDSFCRTRTLAAWRTVMSPSVSSITTPPASDTRICPDVSRIFTS